MYKTEDMVRILNRAGFYKSRDIDSGVSLFLKGKDHKTHALILVENFGDIVSSGYGVERLLELAREREFINTDALILIVDSCTNRALSHLGNVIYFDINVQKICSGRLSSIYKEDFRSIKEQIEMQRQEALFVKDKASLSHTYTNNRVLVTYLLMAVTVLLYAYTRNDKMLYGVSSDLLAAGERYRLFTYMIAHGSIFHLLGNMASLVVIGRALEKQIGSIRFLIIYILSGLAGALVTTTYAADTSIQTVGASGAICGLIAANIVCGMFLPRQRRGSMVAVSAVWLLSILAYGAVWGADNLCHIGGAIGGMAVMLIFAYANGIIYESRLLEATKAHYGRLSELKRRMYTRNASRDNSLTL